MGATTPLTGFDGVPTTEGAFAAANKVFMVPTVMVFDAHGVAASEAIVGCPPGDRSWYAVTFARRRSRYVDPLWNDLALLVPAPVLSQAPPIEDELVLQTPVSKFVVDAALVSRAESTTN